MKKLKLFFALFAMLALGVVNAWGADVTMTAGTNGSACTVNGINGIKVGTFNAGGDMTITVPAGATSLQLYAAAWKGVSGLSINITPEANVNPTSISLTADDGITSNPPFTLKGNAESFKHEVTLSNITSETTLTLKSSTTKRFVVWGATCTVAGGENPGEGGGEDPTPDPEPEPDPDPAPGTGGTGTINFNSSAVKINAASVTGNDDLGNTWTITTVGTTSYTASNAYYQVGSGNKPATSITFTTTLPSDVNVTAFSAKFGGFNSTAGAVTLKVDDTSVGTGSLNATSDVTISNSSQATGKKLTVTLTGIAKGVKVYYISYTYTTSSGGSEPETPATELTDDQFAWSAATAEATMGASNTFPTLTNTLPVSVTYESSNTAAATIAADGTITLVAPGTTTISAKFAGGEVSGTTYAPKTVTYALTVLKAPATPTDNVYVKVTSTAGITDGEYLIVYEAGNVAFNGTLEALDAVGNTLEVTINNNTIAGTNYIDAATFTIDVTNGTILSASGKYIGKTANSNGLDVKTTAMTNTFAIDANGNAVITGNTAALRYNKAADQKRFRYYKDGGGSQEKIALYKKASEQTVTIATCENGSVSASVANDAKVLSGTTITLSNSPATNYKLTAYDVYKTGDNTTKVTVTDGKFVMPEFDVTISATFEQLKELDKIEVNTTNVKTTFWQGETFNSTGLVVTAYYTDETSTIVTPMSITGSTAEAGTKQVTVSYTEGEITKETKYDITIKAIANEEESPYTVTEAREIIDAVGETTVDVYVQGIVSKIVTAYNSEYGNISYNISEDGKTTSAQLQAYRGKSYNGDKFTSADDIQVDDKVVVKGKLKKYDTTYEFAQDNQLVSIVKRKEPKPTAATLPFEFDGNKDDIADVVGMSQTGLGTYDNSPKLKFDTKSDNVIIHFDSEPGEFSFLLKQNGSSAGTFTVYESENGEDYTSIWSGGDLGGTGKSATIKPTISATSRYVKFEYTTKPSGTNYGLGQISIKKIDKRANAELAWSEATVSLTVGDAFTAPTFSNPNSLAVSFESSNTELATVDNAGVITLVDDATGTATITATFEGDAIYKPAEVTCVITVSPKSEKVVILAEYNGQWYALKNAEETAGKVLAALPVNYVGGKLYNVADADKATIEWQLAIDGTIATFKNGENYISGTAGSTDLKLSTTECTWTLVGTTYMLGDRTFLYRAQANGFKNYNAENNAGTDDYSALPVVTAPVYATGTIYTRSELTEGNYGTICLPYASDNYIGATFFKVVGKENNKIVFDEVTALEAGKPYIFLAEATEIKVAQIGEAAIEAGNHNSLQGTFTQIDPAVDNVLKDNYMVVNNVIKKCGANCGLAANRAYFIAGELESLGAAPSPAPSVRRISMGMAGQNTATGVDQVQGDEVPTKMIINGQLFILRGEKMYDAQGKLVK